MVVPIEKLIDTLIGLGIIFGFGYIIYQKIVNDKDMDMKGWGSKILGNQDGFKKGKL